MSCIPTCSLNLTRLKTPNDASPLSEVVTLSVKMLDIFEFDAAKTYRQCTKVRSEPEAGLPEANRIWT